MPGAEEQGGPGDSTRVLAGKGEEVRAQLAVPDHGDEMNLPQCGFRAMETAPVRFIRIKRQTDLI